MNSIEIFETIIKEFKSQNVIFHLTYLKKLAFTRLQTEALRDQITSVSTELINHINEQTNLLLDKVNLIEKKYEETLAAFLDKQREIELLIEKNKQMFELLKSKECISNVNAAKSDLNLAQKHLEELQFVYELEQNTNKFSNLIGIIKVK